MAGLTKDQLPTAFPSAARTRTAPLTLSLALTGTATALPRPVALALSLRTALAGTSRPLPGARSTEALTLTG